jgi:hypothetical protein
MKLNRNKHMDLVSTKYAVSTTEGCINATTDMIGDASEHDFSQGLWSPIEITIDLIEYHKNVSHGFVEAAKAVIGIEALINAYSDGDVSLILITTPTGVASKVVINDIAKYECRENLSDMLMEVVANIILEATDEFIRVRMSDHWLNDSPIQIPVPGGPRKLVGVDRVSFRESILESEEIREFCDIVAEAVFTVFDEIEPMND